jgi:asparagine synthase (glutamine-hydrolysing)
VAPDGVVLLLDEEFGWVRHADPAGEIWFKGYVVLDGCCHEGRAAAECVAALVDAAAHPTALAALLHDLDGSFALLRKTAARTVAAVDRMRSIPLFMVAQEERCLVGDRPRRLVAAAGLRTPDRLGCLELAMAGYVAGGSTIFAEMKQLRAGELAVIAANGVTTQRYYGYKSWEIADGTDEASMKRRLHDITLRLIEKTIRGLGGRPIMLPLSAGLDSRLIASALGHLGYRNVKCYAYGRPGNHEAVASRAIATRLGYPWTFIPYDPAKVRALARSPLQTDYLEFADSCASVPFLQDLLAISELKARGEVPDDAVFINGNSGDFISGNHIHASLLEPRPDLTWSARKGRVLDAYLDKHFSLWRDLRTPDNDRHVRDHAAAALDEALTGPVPADADHGLYEFLECQERQAKFVISGQRVYEFFGHAWRLPLWDKDYLDFWRVTPLSAKAHQRLYRAMLIEANWGGVWDTIPINVKSISPAWVRPLRALAKIACAPLGKNAWRLTEKRVFAYWTDLLSTYAAVPYRRLLFDRRGFRNAIALRCEAYLASKGLGWDGRPEPGHACGS